eukprot:93385-Pyramimonas_sp.AAC.1
MHRSCIGSGIGIHRHRALPSSQRPGKGAPDLFLPLPRPADTRIGSTPRSSPYAHIGISASILGQGQAM